MAKKEQRNHLELGELRCTVVVSDANRVQQSLPRSQSDALPFRESCHLVRHLLGAYEGPVKVPVYRHNLHFKIPAKEFPGHCVPMMLRRVFRRLKLGLLAHLVVQEPFKTIFVHSGRQLEDEVPVAVWQKSVVKMAAKLL